MTELLIKLHCHLFGIQNLMTKNLIELENDWWHLTIPGLRKDPLKF